MFLFKLKHISIQPKCQFHILHGNLNIDNTTSTYTKSYSTNIFWYTPDKTLSVAPDMSTFGVSAKGGIKLGCQWHLGDNFDFFHP